MAEIGLGAAVTEPLNDRAVRKSASSLQFDSAATELLGR